MRKFTKRLIPVLNLRTTRTYIGYGLLGVPVALLFLKPLQVFLGRGVRLPEAVSIGLQNRLDDPSFWTICGAAFACYLVFRVSTEPRCTHSSSAQRIPAGTCTVMMGGWSFVAWLSLVAFGAYIYLDAVKHAREAFWTPFTGQPGDMPILIIQWVEGSLNLFAIAASYFFEVMAFCVVYTTRSPALRQSLDCRLRCYSPTFIFYAVVAPVLVMLLLFALEKAGLGAFLRDYFDWKFAPYKGKSAREALGVFVLFWLPNLFLLLYALIAWHRDVRTGTWQGLNFTLPTLTFKFCECDCQPAKMAT